MPGGAEVVMGAIDGVTFPAGNRHIASVSVMSGIARYPRRYGTATWEASRACGPTMSKPAGRRVAVVTGGAGVIGRAIVAELAATGHTVLSLDQADDPPVDLARGGAGPRGRR